MADLRITGGRKFRATIRKATRERGVDSVRVGIFKTSRYPDGTYVAAVALWIEFGTELDGSEWIPERPAWRNAIRKVRPDVLELVKEGIDTKTLAVDEKLAGKIGLLVQGAIQKEIVDLKEPPNAPVTIHGGVVRVRGAVIPIKGKGSENPLIDTGQLLGSVTFQIER